MDVSRRKTLAVAGAAVGLAGCIGDIAGGNTDDTNGTDTDGNGNGNGNGNENGGGDDPVDDVFQLGSSHGQPLWATVEDATGFITLLEDEYDDIWMVEDPGERDGLQSWLDGTDFEESTIVYVETAAPNTCYTELDISDVAIENGEIVGTAAAVDTSGEDEACADAETYPSAFVRITHDDRPGDATFTVIDGWGDDSEVVADGRYADPTNLPGHVQPDGDPGNLEELSCDDESFQRLDGPADDEAALGEAYDDEALAFAMRVHATQALAGGHVGSPRVGRGHEVRITLWNVSTDVRHTEVRDKWNLQVLTMDGWQDVRGTTDDDGLGYTDVALEQRPGEGFEWAIEMTEDGVVAGHEHEDRLTVCPDLKAGRYRFVYRGIVSGEPLAVEFDYEG